MADFKIILKYPYFTPNFNITKLFLNNSHLFWIFGICPDFLPIYPECLPILIFLDFWPFPPFAWCQNNIKNSKEIENRAIKRPTSRKTSRCIKINYDIHLGPFYSPLDWHSQIWFIYNSCCVPISRGSQQSLLNKFLLKDNKKRP